MKRVDYLDTFDVPIFKTVCSLNAVFENSNHFVGNCCRKLANLSDWTGRHRKTLFPGSKQSYSP